MKDLKQIASVSTLLQELGKVDFIREPYAHARAWFRGHADQLWHLVPGVYREGFLKRKLEDEENERIKKERRLTEDFITMSAGLRDRYLGDPDIYFLQQHYRMPTRLLDWTTSPLAALYFASQDVDKYSQSDNTGILYMLDAYKFITNGAKDRDNIATSRTLSFRRAVSVIFRRRPIQYFGSSIIPVRPSHFDTRIGLQRSCFTFHPPESRMVDGDKNPTLHYAVIPAGHKKELRRELSLLGVDQFTIFGDLENLGLRLREAYQDR